MKKSHPTFRYSFNQGVFIPTLAVTGTFASVFLLSRGFTNTQIGYVISAGSLISVLIQSSVGAYADRQKNCILHKLIISISLIVILFSGILLAPGLPFFLMAALFAVICASTQILIPLTNALGMFFHDRGLPVNYGFARGIGSLCYAVVAVILGRLVEWFSEDSIIVVQIVLSSCLVLSAATFHYPGISEKNTVPDRRESTGEFLKKH